MKKIAVLIYPYFSMQEISCLTDALTVFYYQSIDVFASSKEIIQSEDHFQVIANKTLDEFIIEDYSCLILPGILNPIPALFDENLISFLKTLKGKDIIIASISASPMLLAKAGLLNDVHFTSSIWQEISIHFDFIPHQNIIHQPIVKEKNFITAVGSAFKEFAIEVIRTLNIDKCKEGLFNGVPKDWTEETYTQFMGEENFNQFRQLYSDYAHYHSKKR